MDLIAAGNRQEPLAAQPPHPLLRLDVAVRYRDRTILSRVCLELHRGEAVGLVGSSGSGKSTLSLAILGLLGLRGGKVEGVIESNGRDLLRLPENQFRRIRGKEIALIPQSPLAALNPELTVGAQFREAWRAHQNSIEWRDRALHLLEKLQLDEPGRVLQLYPRQLSVGMAQRVVIAMAILHRPSLVIADEPTSALDAITRAEIIEHFARLNREHGMALLCISHDLASVLALCRRVAILHEGAIVECDQTARILDAPCHPFTRRLIAAIPRMERSLL